MARVGKDSARLRSPRSPGRADSGKKRRGSYQTGPTDPRRGALSCLSRGRPQCVRDANDRVLLGVRPSLLTPTEAKTGPKQLLPFLSKGRRRETSAHEEAASRLGRRRNAGRACRIPPNLNANKVRRRSREYLFSNPLVRRETRGKLRIRRIEFEPNRPGSQQTQRFSALLDRTQPIGLPIGPGTHGPPDQRRSYCLSLLAGGRRSPPKRDLSGAPQPPALALIAASVSSSHTPVVSHSKFADGFDHETVTRTVEDRSSPRTRTL